MSKEKKRLILLCCNVEQFQKLHDVLSILAPEIGFSMRVCIDDGRIGTARKIQKLFP